MDPPIPYPTLQSWKQQIRSTPDPFIQILPKVELHVHLEGTLTPSLRFALAQRNNLPLHSARLNKTFTSLPDLESAYNLLQPRSIKGVGLSAFFEAYYGGMEVLQSEQDFHDLGIEYFKRAKQMGVLYCEVMFDVQAHTRRGVEIGVLMRGLESARREADELGVKVNYIMCFLRDLSPEDAMMHYEMALPYREMIVGIGLDSNEYGRPPLLFDEVYKRAREDGFKLTCHCDVTQKDTHEHIRQVACELGGTGADRIDHGLDAAEAPELVEIIKIKRTGMTLCPWAYVRHHKEENVFGYVRRLFDAGVLVNISSDSPAYVESNWVVDNLMLLKIKGGFMDDEIVKVQFNAVDICWAPKSLKAEMREKIELFLKKMQRK
ncbi:putative adenosine deaminase [Hyaloscypha variabilis]